MPLHTSLLRAFEGLLSAFEGSQVAVDSFEPVHGGSINSAYRIDTSAGSFFAKVNSADALPGLFAKEARGLDFLSRYSGFTIPRVIGTEVTGRDAWLLTEFIRSAPESDNFATDFGRKLAEMHRRSGEKFGLGEDNYIGSLPQLNTSRDDWEDFFAEMRILPQLKKARDADLLTASNAKAFDVVIRKLHEFFPKEAPAPLHGDLWSGNYITDSSGKPAVFDPAVYFGHRYVDLGMTRLFGGFPSGFYTSYFEAYPADSEINAGTEIANLYPLLVHVNLFGGGYAEQVRAILRRYA